MEKKLIDELLRFVVNEGCCNDCFLNKTVELLQDDDITCDDGLRETFINILSKVNTSNDEKANVIMGFLLEYHERNGIDNGENYGE